MPEGDSFLPRIQSVFYAVFDVRQGPKIVYQVPEGLIAISPTGPSNMNGNSVPPTPSTETSPPMPPTTPTVSMNGLTSRNSSTSLVSPTDFYRPGGRHLPSPQKRSSSSQRTLFNFNDISIRHRIIGFPVELKGKYERNYFRYNLCFVFEREADLSCYEPVIRKISRVLKSCEEESAFLSSQQTSPAVHAILEQLYEDLNSYSETSIPIDQFNSIELKIFPFYPNPPPLRDWMVPLALINLSKRIEDNWDLTMFKVCKYIDGINHVNRIAHLADCDISLTRQAMSHLLYYQVIMMIDIFQYSNMYTLRKSIQWLADEAHVKEECGHYVTKPGKNIPDWPKLLHLYSRLKPGKTIFEWMKWHDVESLGIDVRRFTSFGVIKGFLRRVHRYPVYLPPDPSESAVNQAIYPSQSPVDKSTDTILARRRGKSLSGGTIRLPPYGPGLAEDAPGPDRLQGQPSVTFPNPTPETTSYETEASLPAAQPTTISASHRARRASAAEKVLEQLRSRDMQKSVTNAVSSPRSSWINFQQDNAPPATTATTTVPMSTVDATFTTSSATLPHASPTKGLTSRRSESRRQSLIAPAVPPSSPVTGKISLTPSRPPRPSRSPSAPHINQPASSQAVQPVVPPGLKAMLNGEHHTDELSVKFEAGWPLLEQWLRTIGGGEEPGDYGRVVIIYK